MTRWTAELRDRDQERRFRRYNLPQQRRTALASLVLILLADVASFGSSVWIGHVTVAPVLVAVQAVVTATGAGFVIALTRARRPRRIFRTVVGAVLFLTVAVAVLIATGHSMGFRGALLVVGGVVVIYLSAPLTLAGVSALGLLYSAVTIPVWLLATDAFAVADVGYVLVATALAHGLSLVEAGRAQRERRLLFAQREQWHRLSGADPLTGLVNRRAFDELLAQFWRGWHGDDAPLSLLMVDIDHFKLLNDSDGHAAGDRALRAVALAIRDALPAGRCHAARFGGEEFACLLPDLDGPAAWEVAVRVLERVRQERIAMPGPGRRTLTVSVGVGTAGPGMHTEDELVDAADRQLYRAKQAGRDRACSDDGGGTVAPVTALPGLSA